jgi:uncharacterized protein GlcG (DUF336 family)
MITYKSLNLAEAHLILDAAQKKCEEMKAQEVLCVADPAGYPIALRRLDGGKVSSVQIALNKAFTAAAHRKPTHVYKNAQPGGDAFGIFTQHDGRFTTFVGGFPIVVDGQVVGSVAASGGNAEEDTSVCQAGIEAFMKHIGK